MKTFHNKQNLKEIMTTKPALQKIFNASYAQTKKLESDQKIQEKNKTFQQSRLVNKD
jgi:hypothetical protein